MKSTIFLLLAILASITTHAQKEKLSGRFVLNGRVIGQDTGIISLGYENENGKYIRDSASLKNGNFTFIGFISEPTNATLVGKIKSRSVDDPNFTEIFIEAKDIKSLLRVNDFKHAKITGSRTHDEWAKIEKKKAPIRKEMEPIERELSSIRDSLRKDKNNEELNKRDDAIREKLIPYNKRMAKIDYQFIVAHPAFYLSPYLLLYDMQRLSYDSIKMFFDSFTHSIQHSRFGRIVGNEVGGIPGCMAKDFTAVTLYGDTISLSAFKEKSYVLLDFWATWCIPCRNNSTHLIKLYQGYHSKGLEIIGVANDDNRKEIWKKAIIEDKTGIWLHVLQGFGGENDIGKKFGITPIPAKILIDKNEVIIGRYEGDNDFLLDKKLSEIFK
jgi:thiol-disulfide isomerase/thioredoxin